MRQLLLASAALLGLAGGTAFAQTAPGQTAPGQPMPAAPGSSAAPSSQMNGSGGNMGPGGSMGSGTMRSGGMSRHGSAMRDQEPHSTRAGNIGSADTHTTYASQLPIPNVGDNASPDAYLQAAQSALSRHRTGAAQEALERAETRLLDRSVAPSNADTPISSPRVQNVQQAREALGRGDINQAQQLIGQAMAANGSDMSGGGMPGGGMSGGGMPGGGMSGANMPGTDKGGAGGPSPAMGANPAEMPPGHGNYPNNQGGASGVGHAAPMSSGSGSAPSGASSP